MGSFSDLPGAAFRREHFLLKQNQYDLEANNLGVWLRGVGGSSRQGYFHGKDYIVQPPPPGMPPQDFWEMMQCHSIRRGGND